jgi:hypothetical protein
MENLYSELFKEQPMFLENRLAHLRSLESPVVELLIASTVADVLSVELTQMERRFPLERLIALSLSDSAEQNEWMTRSLSPQETAALPRIASLLSALPTAAARELFYDNPDVEFIYNCLHYAYIYGMVLNCAVEVCSAPKLQAVKDLPRLELE